MADDEKDYTAAQKKHGDKLAFERSLMDATGVSRSQVRAYMAGHVDRVLGQRVLIDTRQQVPRPAEPKVQTTDFQTAPRAMVKPEANAAGQDGAQDKGPISVLSCNVNGALGTFTGSGTFSLL